MNPTPRIEVVNPDFKEEVKVRLRCYEADPRPVVDREVVLRPLEARGVPAENDRGGNRSWSGFCHLRASKPVFAHASRRVGQHDVVHVPMWHAGD